MTFRAGEDIPHPLTPRLSRFVLISLPDYLLIDFFFFFLVIQLTLRALCGSVAGPDVFMKLALASPGSQGMGSLNQGLWDSSDLGWGTLGLGVSLLDRSWGFGLVGW